LTPWISTSASWRSVFTDVELLTGQLAYFAQGKTAFPLRPGHEWCGVVSALGADVDSGWLGARVTGDTMLGCGRCSRCLAGRGHVCADRREVGIMGWPGALAEKVLIRASSLHRLPGTIDDRAGALVEPGGNGWRAASAAQAGPGMKLRLRNLGQDSRDRIVSFRPGLQKGFRCPGQHRQMAIELACIDMEMLLLTPLSLAHQLSQQLIKLIKRLIG
jgi:hypothetical protein